MAGHGGIAVVAVASVVAAVAAVLFFAGKSQLFWMQRVERYDYVHAHYYRGY